jgi:hypothetical protein
MNAVAVHRAIENKYNVQLVTPLYVRISGRDFVAVFTHYGACYKVVRIRELWNTPDRIDSIEDYCFRTGETFTVVPRLRGGHDA